MEKNQTKYEISFFQIIKGVYLLLSDCRKNKSRSLSP